MIKTFMMSAFNHLFIMLPNPDSTLIDKIMFSFWWNKKPSKIKQATIIKQYGEGGLKMINIMAFIETLKSTWIRRFLITDNKWQMFIKKYIQIEKLTGCNIKYIEKMITHLPNKFWKDVLICFVPFKTCQTRTTQDVTFSFLTLYSLWDIKMLISRSFHTS